MRRPPCFHSFNSCFFLLFSVVYSRAKQSVRPSAWYRTVHPPNGKRHPSLAYRNPDNIARSTQTKKKSSSVPAPFASETKHARTQVRKQASEADTTENPLPPPPPPLPSATPCDLSDRSCSAGKASALVCCTKPTPATRAGLPCARAWRRMQCREPTGVASERKEEQEPKLRWRE